MIFAVVVCVGSLAAPPPEQLASAQDLRAYEAAAARISRSPEAHVKMSLWCEAHGLKAERIKHLALAVLMDSKNATARGLMGLVAYGGQWKRPEAVAEKIKADEVLTGRLAEYNARRARTAEKADAQWELALWCEKNGLEAEARAHFTTVTRLDPSREAAWKRLGCKKVGGRWASEAQIGAWKDEAEARKKSDKHWKPLLTKWNAWLGEAARRDEAETALAGVTDPHAVAAVWSVFVAGGVSTHDRAVQILGQIDAPEASRALAFLAAFDDSAGVRRRATETLRQCDPREFAGMLVALLRDPIKYQVKPVGGPGSPGAMFVEGRKFNVRRQYAAPAMPSIAILPNDWVDYDEDGFLVITRPMAATISQSHYPLSQPSQFMSLSQFANFNPTDPALAASVAEFRANSQGLWAGFFRTHRNNGALQKSNPGAESRNLGVSIGKGVSRTSIQTLQKRIPVGQIMSEYQKMAIGAQQQLAQDAATVDAYNEEVRQVNERFSQVLRGSTGQDHGEDPESWRAWWVDVKGYAYTPSKDSPRPTIDEYVPPAYMPQPTPVVTYTQQFSNSMTGPVISPYSSMPSCFGAGTLVRTLDGSRPIESIRVGDRVLTQDIRTGSLGYQPVTFVHHNPPSPTFLVKVDNDTIISSPFHRFWVSGQGWVMARNLKGGEQLRLLGGLARVASVEEGPEQPVFNLDVAEAHDFFAGVAAALVHDNTLPETRLEPFDAATSLVTAATTP